MMDVRDIEAQRLVEQERLDVVKKADERNRWGQFATPPALALDIARYARRKWGHRQAPVRFLEPAIGTGSFYAALRQTFPSDGITASAGFEIDTDFARTAARLWAPTGLSVNTTDFTAAVPSRNRQPFNLILTNPPYVRHHHISREEKKRLKRAVGRELGIEISGLAGLYVYFLLLCDKWLDDGGLAVWLIPSEFMDVNYGAAVRRYLTRNVTLSQIHRFCPSDVQFTDALVSSAIVAFRKSAPPPHHSVIFSFGGRLAKPDLKQRIPLTELQTCRKWTKYPREVADNVPNENECLTLGDLFTIKRGLATGANNFFVIPREEARRVGIPTECTRPILPSPRYLREHIIEASRDGYPIIERSLSLIDCDFPEDEIRERHPAFWAYLQTGRKRNLHKGYLASRRSPWFSQEKRDPAPFLCTYMGRARDGRKPFRFIWNKSEATAANVYLLLYPKSCLERALKSAPNLYAVVFDFLQSIGTNMLVGESRVYGGGLYKLEPKELARVSAEPIRAIVRGVDRHRQLPLFA